MDAFSYLSVLLSIILGLAITQVLQGYRALILNRRQVRFYWLSIAWSLIVLFIAVQHWWASFGLADRTDWSFLDFAVVLIGTGLIYMVSAIVLPDVPPGEPLDLKAHYWREAPAAFAITIAAVLWSIVREWQLDGRLPRPDNLVFHLLFIAVSLLGLVVRRERVHQAIALLISGLFLTYVFLLFSRLAR